MSKIGIIYTILSLYDSLALKVQSKFFDKNICEYGN